MHCNFIFYFLIFLFNLQPISPTSTSSKILLDKMDKFYNKFKGQIVKFDQKFVEIFVNENELKNEQFGNAMFKKEFPLEIINAKREIEKYLQGEIIFKVIFDAINNLKLEDGKLKALETFYFQLKDFKDLKGQLLINLVTETDQIKKQLDLVEYLMEMHETVNEFVEEIIAQLRINHIKGLIKKVDNHIKVQKTEFDEPYEKFLKYYSKEFFPMIENYIKSAKYELEWKYSKYLEWPNNSMNNVPLELIENRDMLKKEIFNSKPLLEKVTLKKSIEWNNSHLNRMQQYLVKFNGILAEYVDELPKLCHKNDHLRFGDRIQKYYESFNSKLDDHSKSLIIACNKMLDLIKSLFNKKANMIEENGYLTDIHYLTTFIEEEFAKMNIPVISLETEELPKEFELMRSEKDPKRKAILIAKNMLFIAAQMRKCHNFEDAIDETYKDNPKENSKNARIYKLVLKELPTQSFGQFVYQKYVVEKEQELERQKTAKRKQNDAETSSTNVGGNERGKDKKKGKTTME